MSREFPKSAKLRRRSGWKPARLKIIIICEGETERDYFYKFSQQKRNPLVIVEATGKGGPVRTLIGKVLSTQKEITRQARKSQDSYEMEFVVWGVPDVDEHPKLVEAMNLAKEHQLNIAISNPCFELWGILHFVRQDAPIGRHKAQRLLTKHMPSYQHDKHPYFDLGLLDDEKLSDATENAKWGLNRRIEEGDPHGNPSSNVHELVEHIVTGNRLKSA